MLSLRELLFGSTALTEAPQALPERRPFALRTGVSASVTKVGNAADLWKPASRPPMLDAAPDMAMDYAPDFSADMARWAGQYMIEDDTRFLGFPALAQLAQRPEYRRISEIFASEATRKWIKLRGTPKRVEELEKELDRLDVRQRFRELAEHDGFFGRAHLFIDLGDASNSKELETPLSVVPAKVKKGGLRNLKVVEPVWCYPLRYETSDPTRPEFYMPAVWQCMSQRIHRSRLLTFVGREVPDILKASYAFGGVPLSQMAKPYIDNWLRTRQSVSDLIHSFSVPVLKTDMGSVMTGGGAETLIERAQLFNRTRDNRGLMMIDKDAEDFDNISTPLSTLDKLQAQAQEHIASVTGIPLVILLGVTPSGLNASSDGEVRTFYATVKAYQERIFRRPLEMIIRIAQMSAFGDIDESIALEFIDLWETSETERATIRKSDADADVAYANAGIISPEEVRERISQDESSPYHGVDLSDAPPDMNDGEDDDSSDDDEPAA